MNKLKPSYYNIGVKSGAGTVLFNTFTGVMNASIVSKEAFDWLLHGESKGDSLPGELCDEIDNLLAAGFVVEKHANEIDKIRYLQKLNRWNESRYCSLVLVPTMKCNMACTYCFEREKRSGKMDERVQNAIIDYVKTRLEDGVKEVNIVWFGGEPLLEKEIIYALSERLIKLCLSYDSRYKATIITNGTLLSKDVAKKLKNSGVEKAQITLDGPPQIHNKRRMLKNGLNSFKRILRNIVESAEIIDIAVRCNIDHANRKSAKALCQILSDSGLSSQVSLSFEPVHGCSYHNCDLFSNQEFAGLELELAEIAGSYGFNCEPSLSPKMATCMATSLSSYVVASDGLLYKCPETVGVKEEVLGDIFSGPSLEENLFKWVNFDPIGDEECRNCKLLPICQGHCVFKSIKSNNEPVCSRSKYNIHNILKSYLKKGGEYEGKISVNA